MKNTPSLAVRGFTRLLTMFMALMIGFGPVTASYAQAVDPVARGLGAKANATANSAKTYDFFKSLRARDVSPAMASPPTISLVSAVDIANPVTVALNSSQVTWRHTANIVSKGSGYYTGGHISVGTPGVSMAAYSAALAFRTDATVAEIPVLAQGNDDSFAVWVDGQPVNRNFKPRNIPFQTTQYIKIDFGADTKTVYALSAAVVAGGTGYAVGDDYVPAGGTGTAPTLTVTRVSGGVVTGIGVKTPGSYSTAPSGTLTQASTTGSGTGLTVTIGTGQANAARKMRTIEVYPTRTLWLGPLRVGPSDTVIAAPVRSDPLVMWIGDSFLANFHANDQSLGFGQIALDRLGVENWMLSGLPGTGWLQTAGSSVKLRDRIVPDIIAYQPSLVIIGPFGYNDNPFSAAAIEAEVSATMSALAAALPNTYFINLGVNVGFSAGTPSTAQKAAIAAGFASGAPARRSLYIDSNAEGWQTGGGGGPSTATTTGNAQYYIASDGIHPSQQGDDNLGWHAAKAIERGLSILFPNTTPIPISANDNYPITGVEYRLAG